MSNNGRVQDLVAIVTGAGSGIGQASAIRLAEEGATVVCADINGESVNATEKQIVDAGFKAEGRSIDISDSQACTDLVDSTATKYGSVDILVKRLVEEKAHRPLIADLSEQDLTKFIKDKLIERHAYYSQANYRLSSDQITDTALKQIIQQHA